MGRCSATMSSSRVKPYVSSFANSRRRVRRGGFACCRKDRSVKTKSLQDDLGNEVERERERRDKGRQAEWKSKAIQAGSSDLRDHAKKRKRGLPKAARRKSAGSTSGRRVRNDRRGHHGQGVRAAHVERRREDPRGLHRALRATARGLQSSKRRGRSLNRADAARSLASVRSCRARRGEDGSDRAGRKVHHLVLHDDRVKNRDQDQSQHGCERQAADLEVAEWLPEGARGTASGRAEHVAPTVIRRRSGESRRRVELLKRRPRAVAPR